jgi:hypothetical protein
MEEQRPARKHVFLGGRKIPDWKRAKSSRCGEGALKVCGQALKHMVLHPTVCIADIRTDLLEVLSGSES